MKILQINTVCTGSSTATISAQLARLVTAIGGESLIAYGRNEAAPSVESIRIENMSEFLTHALLSRLTDRQGFFSTPATRKLCDFIHRYNPDVIHLHNLHGYYLNIKILFETLAKLDKPVVWTLHDCWALSGHCVYIGDCPKWRTGCGDCPKIHLYPNALVDQSARNLKEKQLLFTLVGNLTIVTPSDWLGRLVRRSFLSEYPVEVIPNGIDLNVFKPSENDFRTRHSIKADEKIVLGVANFRDTNKGLDDFTTLSKTVPGCRIVLVGLSEKQIASLPKGILGLSRVNDPAELAKIYSAGDVFVNPTYADNFPTVNLEALACGIPVVTYDTGGSAESIGSSGIAVPTGDREALSAAVQMYLMNPPSLELCRVQAAAFDKNARFAEYLRLYEKLAEGGKQ